MPHQVFVSLYPDLKTWSSFEIFHDPAMYNKKKIKFPFIDKLTTSFLVLNKNSCFEAPLKTPFLIPVPILFSHTHLFTYFSFLFISFYHFPPNSHLFSPSFSTVFFFRFHPLFPSFYFFFFHFQSPSFPIPFLLCQHAKKVVSDSLGLVDFVIRLLIFVLNLPNGQVLFFVEIQTKDCNQSS